jgi:hypothetical protein
MRSSIVMSFSVLCLSQLVLATTPAHAQGADSSTSGTTSSSSSSYHRGYGFKDANVFAPKYKERLKNWREQLDLGVTKGFLKPEDATRFTLVLDRLTALEADMASKNYPKAETDSMEQDFNGFNVDFTNAMQPKPVPAVVAPPVVTPPAVVPPVVARPVVKPPAAKVVVKKPLPKKVVKKPTPKHHK